MVAAGGTPLVASSTPLAKMISGHTGQHSPQPTAALHASCTTWRVHPSAAVNMPLAEVVGLLNTVLSAGLQNVLLTVDLSLLQVDEPVWHGE